MLSADADVAIIGGGVVGCAAARAFAVAGASVVLLERSCDILAGASKGNSAILHTGFDAPVGSMEQQLVSAGYRRYLEINERLNLPILRAGALVVARTGDELARLPDLQRAAISNGVHDVAILSASEVHRREPHLALPLLAALEVPGESIIDPWSAPLAYLTHALSRGAKALFDTELVAGAFDGERWHLTTTRGAVRAAYVVNCAGLYGDIVERRCLGTAHFEIRPRKGQFAVFDKAAAAFVGAIILPIPSKRSKGVVVTRTIFGNVLVGPTAEDQDERESASTDGATLRRLIATAAEIVPALARVPVTATFAGLRPATGRSDYVIALGRAQHWLTLGGIRSTGLTAALGLADHAVELVAIGANAGAQDESAWPAVPNLAEHRPRDWERPGYGEIVCHCEMVTQREIDRAFLSELPPRDLAGLRRRTRAGLGRCQGFHCGAKLARALKDRGIEVYADGTA